MAGQSKAQMAPPKLARKELVRLLNTEFPEAAHAIRGYAIEETWHGGAGLRLSFHDQLLRPGGTISGPTLMALADFALYVAVLSAIGWVPLAVTTNLSINFLKRPAPRDVLAEAQLLKLGKRLAVGEVGLRSDGDSELAAHVVATYSIPPAAMA